MSFVPRFEQPRPYGRVAVLVDAESVPLGAAAQILAAAQGLGGLVLRRAYGHSARAQDWAEISGFQVARAGAGRNATGLLIGSEAMGLMLTGKADRLLIASVSQDLAPVVDELRRRGFDVVGMGADISPLPFRRACRDFIDLAPLPYVRMAAQPLRQGALVS